MKIIEESYNWANTNFKKHKPDTIVIHHAEVAICTAQQVHGWHINRGWKGMAYHYFVRKDGSIFRGRQENQRGGHLLSAENNNTLGICLEGNYDKEKVVPEAQIQALIWLCSDIETRWKIKAYRKHADYKSAKNVHKLCPGVYFPWDKFISEVELNRNKAIIQEHVKLDAPQLLWDIIDKHPYKYDLYRKLADSYKR